MTVACDSGLITVSKSHWEFEHALNLCDSVTAKPRFRKSLSQQERIELMGISGVYVTMIQ